MGLMDRAYETYIKHKDFIGKIEEGKAPLSPIAHMMQNIQLEITLGMNGNFITAVRVDKDDSASLIPVTIKSSCRSSAPEPHPLCDKIQYLTKGDTVHYKKYIELLAAWADSEYANNRLTAIYKYIKNGKIICDLENSDIEYKESDMVRWRVLGDIPSRQDECWQSTEMFESWQRYYFSVMDGTEDLCMLSGKESVIAENHPKGIVAKYFNSKLVSANDKDNFTYRGRFIDARQALTIGYEASQYAHNALIWLSRNQSVSFVAGGRTFICWNPAGHRVPNVWDNLFDVDKDDEIKITPSNYKKYLHDKVMSGYKESLPLNADVILAAFDAATTGRLSLTYYSELKGVDFLKRVEYWYDSCCWHNYKYGVQSPNINDIVKYTYGVYSSKDDRTIVNEKIHREQFQRIFKCVTENTVIPYDLVKILINKVSRPQSYKNNSDAYKKLIFITCAMVRKYYNDKSKKEEWKLNLEPNKKDRSYQFGRLLAVMEKVETDTYDSSEQREANAIRLQSAFCERPWHYTNIIHQKLAPYFARHKQNARRYFKKLIGEIMEELSAYPDYELDKRLADTYILGYYLQRNELYRKHAKNDAAEEVEE